MSLPKTHFVSLIEKHSESPDGIQYKEVDAPQITGAKDVIIKNRYSGVNFIDAYFRKNLYPCDVPYIFGKEAAGEVAAVGSEVSRFKVGDKVAYIGINTFAQYTKIPEDYVRIAKLPADSSDEQLKTYAGALLSGLTAITFAHDAHPVQKGDFLLVWAAAGGFGQLFIQYVTKKLGARVIAVASTEEKLQKAKSLGAEFLINSSTDDVVAKTNEFTGGAGATVSYDSIGKDTWQTSLAALGLKGHWVSFGNASGLVPPFSILELSPKNLKVSRPTLFGFTGTHEEFDKWTKILFDLLNSGVLKLDIYKTYPLKDYAQATSDLESRKSTGKLVIEIPQ